MICLFADFLLFSSNLILLNSEMQLDLCHSTLWILCTKVFIFSSQSCKVWVRRAARITTAEIVRERYYVRMQCRLRISMRQLEKVNIVTCLLTVQ